MGTRDSIARFGSSAGWLACAATVAYGVVQVLQLAGVLTFPLDEVLIYGTSLVIVVPFLLMITALHHLTEDARKYWSLAALVLSVIYAVFVTANYVVQLVTVLPAKVAGAREAVALLDQTPHSLFWCFDAIGYIAMGIAALLAVNAFEPGAATRGVRRALAVHAAVTPLITIVYFYPVYSTSLLWLGFPWAITAPWFMGAVARELRRRVAPQQSPPLLEILVRASDPRT